MSPLDRETGLAQTVSVDPYKTISPARSIGERLSLRHLFLSAAVIFVPLSQAFSGVDPATDWPAWRGPTRDGIAAPDQNPPLQWSETEGVLWKVPLPGRGHGSPTVVGDRVYLATADVENQFVLCLSRNTGQRVWETKVHGGKPDVGSRPVGHGDVARFSWPAGSCRVSQRGRWQRRGRWPRAAGGRVAL